jgi:Lectin C-type domain/Concanavalin A-like lectin/glucanases superfamily
MRILGVASLLFPLLAAVSSYAATLAPIYHSDSGHWYQIIEEHMPWEEARLYAEKSQVDGYQGYLATITSERENKWLTDALTVASQEQNYWIGGYRPPAQGAQSDGWCWVTGEPFNYSNWKNGEPSGYDGSEDKLQFYRSDRGQWNDNRASYPLPFIIEYGASGERSNLPEPEPNNALADASSSEDINKNFQTHLFCHFNNSLTAKNGTRPSSSGNIQLMDGWKSGGVHVAKQGWLAYSTADQDYMHRSLEFRFKPDWNGDDNQSHFLFEIGPRSDQRFALVKDTNNILKFEVKNHMKTLGIHHSINDWKAGQWYHIRANWGSSGISLYVDGTRVSGQEIYTAHNLIPQNIIVIGNSMTERCQNGACGTFDDLRYSTGEDTVIHVPRDYPTIQAAIDEAVNGDEIVVATGTYVGSVHFNDKIIVLRSANPADPTVIENTVLDGGKSGSVVIFSGSETSSCTLAGFVIRNGRAEKGAGILGNQCHATITNNIILDNHALRQGGGIHGCHGLLAGNTISNNSSNRGGGLFGCHGKISDNLIFNNKAISIRGIADRKRKGSGAGLHSCNGSITDNIIVYNLAHMNESNMVNCNDDNSENRKGNAGRLHMGNFMHDSRHKL